MMRKNASKDIQGRAANQRFLVNVRFLFASHELRNISTEMVKPYSHYFNRSVLNWAIVLSDRVETNLTFDWAAMLTGVICFAEKGSVMLCGA